MGNGYNSLTPQTNPPILIGDDKFIESVIFDPMFIHYTHPTSTTPQSTPSVL